MSIHTVGRWAKAALVAAALVTATALPAGAAQSVSTGEAMNGKVLQVKAGSLVSVALHSTYWKAAKLPKASVLRRLGPMVATPIPPGPKAPAGCRVAGSGCGTVVWKFTAVHTGTATFVATRTTCGEAMRCSAGQSRYSLTIRVVR